MTRDALIRPAQIARAEWPDQRLKQVARYVLRSATSDPLEERASRWWLGPSQLGWINCGLGPSEAQRKYIAGRITALRRELTRNPYRARA